MMAPFLSPIQSAQHTSRGGVLFGRRSHRGTPTRQRGRLDLVCGRSDNRGYDPHQRLRRVFAHRAERFAGYGVGRLVRLLDLGTWGGSRAMTFGLMMFPDGWLP